MEQKPVFGTYSNLAHAILEHGLPVTLEAGGSGVQVEVTKISELPQKAQSILNTAGCCGNGVVINDDK